MGIAAKTFGGFRFATVNKWMVGYLPHSVNKSHSVFEGISIAVIDFRVINKTQNTPNYTCL